MADCRNCRAKSQRIAVAEPGSVMVINRLKYGGTHTDDLADRRATYCQFCGKPLRIIGTERFCNNVNCFNRYESV